MGPKYKQVRVSKFDHQMTKNVPLFQPFCSLCTIDMLNKDSLQTFFLLAYQYHFLQTYLTSLSIDVRKDSYKYNIRNFINHKTYSLGFPCRKQLMSSFFWTSNFVSFFPWSYIIIGKSCHQRIHFCCALKIINLSFFVAVN